MCIDQRKKQNRSKDLLLPCRTTLLVWMQLKFVFFLRGGGGVAISSCHSKLDLVCSVHERVARVPFRRTLTTFSCCACFINFNSHCVFIALWTEVGSDMSEITSPPPSTPTTRPSRPASYQMYDATPEQLQDVREYAKMREQLKKEFQMKVTDPYSRMRGGHIVSGLILFAPNC